MMVSQLEENEILKSIYLFIYLLTLAACSPVILVVLYCRA